MFKPSGLKKVLSNSDVVQYNKVYDTLVSSEKDIVGQLAYCLYKQSKQKYIREFESRNNRSPTDEELNNHVECSEINKLADYRKQAKSTVKELLSQAAEQKKGELEDDFKKRLWGFIGNHKPDGVLANLGKGFKSLIVNGFGGVVGNFFTTEIIIFIIYSMSSFDTKETASGEAKTNIVTGIAKYLQVDVTINQPESSDS